MVDLGTTLFAHLFQVPIAERIGQVPTDTEQDDVFFETVTLKVDHAEARGANRWARSLPKSKTSPLTQQNQHKGRLTVADVLSRIKDGRPGVETAWAQIATLADERKSLVWCEEMRHAWAACLPLLERGDAIAARMAFKEEYTRLLTAARRERTPPQWTLTPGSDPDQREQVVTAAAAQGLITAAHAATLLPYHQPPTPAGQALLEAAAAMM